LLLLFVCVLFVWFVCVVWLFVWGWFVWGGKEGMSLKGERKKKQGIKRRAKNEEKKDAEREGKKQRQKKLTRVGVGRHLPPAQVDGLEARGRHLHRLLPRQGAQRVHVGLAVHRLPQLLGAHARERVLDLDRAAQLLDVGLAVDALDAREAVGGAGRHGFWWLLVVVDLLGLCVCVFFVCF
jgi:hypothetical protein